MDTLLTKCKSLFTSVKVSISSKIRAYKESRNIKDPKMICRVPIETPVKDNEIKQTTDNEVTIEGSTEVTVDEETVEETVEETPVSKEVNKEAPIEDMSVRPEVEIYEYQQTKKVPYQINYGNSFFPVDSPISDVRDD